MEIVDKVRLKSGGPTMTVTRTNPDQQEVVCLWFEMLTQVPILWGNLRSGVFKEEALESID